MKSGDMIEWTSIRYIFGQTEWYTRTGVIINVGPSPAYTRSIFVLTLNGEQIILPEDSNIIKVLEIN